MSKPKIFISKKAEKLKCQNAQKILNTPQMHLKQGDSQKNIHLKCQ